MLSLLHQVQSPFRNFLSQDFITEVLPLHVPPPSLSELYYYNNNEQQEPADIFSDEEDEDFQSWKSDEEEENETMITTLSSDSFPETTLLYQEQDLLRRHSISTFTGPSSPPLSSFTPLSTTAVSCAISSSPPHLSNTNHQVWQETIQKLKNSLIVSPPIKRKAAKKKKLIPMPPAPRRPLLSKRRSEATTQPRFDPITNTYTRDTRSNPDHLRMISAELNMMRAKKLLSPLKPRGFLPRRKDAFVRGDKRKLSHLNIEW